MDSGYRVVLALVGLKFANWALFHYISRMSPVDCMYSLLDDISKSNRLVAVACESFSEYCLILPKLLL